ncbi:MAG: hypothetical protein H6722_22915 [Sandaracinus sp.]|nr:hypothetical protein [Sandaracinus sp.]MCB9615295.1 hypothetical protein [Sandaracinus sp.]MCB9621527.1 hypothetical protein [Sandaracinus sp.]MCB9622456.1 hypothetical protein [Sandaracinus sp.]
MDDAFRQTALQLIADLSAALGDVEAEDAALNEAPRARVERELHLHDVDGSPAAVGVALRDRAALLRRLNRDHDREDQEDHTSEPQLIEPPPPPPEYEPPEYELPPKLLPPP